MRPAFCDLGPSSIAHFATTFPDFLPRICIEFYATLKGRNARRQFGVCLPSCFETAMKVVRCAAATGADASAIVWLGCT